MKSDCSVPSATSDRGGSPALASPPAFSHNTEAASSFGRDQQEAAGVDGPVKVVASDEVLD